MARSGRLYSGKLPGCTCPVCHATTDGFTAITDGAPPVKDDITVCIYCCNILVFQPLMGIMTLRLPTAEERPILDGYELIQRVRLAALERVLGTPSGNA